MLDVRHPLRPPDEAASHPGTGDVLLFGLDDAGLCAALPVAAERAAALGCGLTIAARARRPLLWAFAGAGWAMMPAPCAAELGCPAEVRLRRLVRHYAPGTDAQVICRRGRPERWAPGLLAGRYGTVIIGAAGSNRWARRRLARLRALIGAARVVDVLPTPAGELDRELGALLAPPA